MDPEITSARDWHSTVAILHVDDQNKKDNPRKDRCITVLSELRMKYKPEEINTKSKLQCTLKFSDIPWRQKGAIVQYVKALKTWLGNDKVTFFAGEAAAGQDRLAGRPKQVAGAKRARDEVAASPPPKKKNVLLPRVTDAVNKCSEYLPKGMPAAECWAYGPNEVKIVINDCVELWFQSAKANVHIANFFILCPPDVVSELKKKSGDRTLAGQTMQWIRAVAKALNATTLTLDDMWQGKSASKLEMMSNALQGKGADNADVMWRAKRHEYNTKESSADNIAARLDRSGFYGMWNFEYVDGRKMSVNVANMPILNGAFVDLSA